MLKFLKNEANKTYTENGAVTYATTNSDCLDLFSTIGGLRQAGDEEIVKRFSRAYAENPDLAMKIVFYARDIRGGLGERKVFRIILKWLAENERESLIKNIDYIARYGRYDDLLALMDTPCRSAMEKLIAAQLKKDISALDLGEDNVSLLAKWLPSVNASNKQTVLNAKRIARAMGMRDESYRKTLSRLRAKIAIIENNLRLKDYTFNYEIEPSKAMFKYRKAFIRNDGERYGQFIQRVKNGEAKLNTGTLFPYEVIAPCISGNLGASERQAIDATWNALADYTSNEDALVVVDGSGSMYNQSKPMPAAVALSLGVYFAEKNKGAFRNHFITFSENPRLVEVKGKDICEKIRYSMSFNEVANTNIQAVFDLILRTAVNNKLKQKDIPGTIYIVSDMEFDRCALNSDMTNFKLAKRNFEKRGYHLPKMVFWNVASRALQLPVTMNEQGVALVSGCTSRLFSMVLSGNMSPYEYMLEIIGSERYSGIVA